MAQPEHGRRRFFNQLARDLLVGAGEVRGIRHITYGELMSAPDDRLGKVTPGIREGVRILAGEGAVGAMLPDGSEISLFDKSDVALLIFNSFDGQRTLDRIGEAVAGAMHWPPERGFAAARALFLKLTCAGVAVVCNSWEP
jgi:hypothetical protein